MRFPIIASIVAVALFVAYLAPIMWKLKDGALIAVILIGLALMIRDLWDSLREEDD